MANNWEFSIGRHQTGPVKSLFPAQLAAGDAALGGIWWGQHLPLLRRWLRQLRLRLSAAPRSCRVSLHPHTQKGLNRLTR